MDAYFFTFSKRENSTKQPVLNTGNKAEIILKAPTSILNPVIEMDLGIIAAPATINYMYIPDFGRYYWLTEPGWVWENRKWVGHFTVDVLASWKTGIGRYNIVYRYTMCQFPKLSDNYIKRDRTA